MRYERKYKIDNISQDVVKQAVAVHPASFRKIYPDRQINNIYFDTPNLKAFNENVNGVSERKKYRVRWYGKRPTEISQPNLEIKIRQNQVGSKIIKPVNEFSLTDLRFISKEVNHIIEDPIYLQPVLMNSYYRSYYGTSDGKYRVTVDWRMRYFSLLAARHFTRYTVEDFNTVVVEIKYDKNTDIVTDRITQHFPFRQTKSSKYVNGILLTMYK